MFPREKEGEEKKKEKGEGERRDDSVYIADRFKTRSRKGFSIKSPGG